VVALAGALYFLDPDLRRPIAERMTELGPPISHRGLADGVPVYDSGGRRVGVVDRAMEDPVTGIFEGIVIHTLPLPGRHVYADHEQIAELRERGVRLSVSGDELHELSERSARARGTRETPESPLERRLRRAWDWITGFR
jgi:hypothetical protein